MDSTEKVTYEIVIDDSKATATGKKVADTFKDIGEKGKQAASANKDFSGALDKIAPGLSSTVSGFGGLLNSFKAIVLSPVGLVLGAIAGAFTVIKAAIEKSEPALDFIEDVMTRISSTADALLSNLSLIGDFFGNILTGDLAGASAAFGKLTEEIDKNNQAAQEYLDTTRELEDEQFKFRISTADTENKIKALIIASKNRNLSFDEAQAKIKEATELEKEMTDERIRLANKRTDSELNEIARKRGVFREEGEQFDAFLQRFTTQTEISEKEKTQIADLNDTRKRAASDSLSFQEKTQNQLEAIVDRRAAMQQKEIERLLSIAELTRQIDNERAERAKAQAAQEIIDTNAALDRLIAKRDAEQQLHFDSLALMAEEQEAESAAADAAFELDQKKTKSKQEEVKVDFLLGQQKLANASTVLNQVAGLLDKGTAAYKVLAISQAFVDTYRAATAALAPPPIGAGPLFGPILAGTTIALGLANVAKIASFAEGGFTSKGNPRERATNLGPRWYEYHKDEYIAPSRVINTNEGRYHVSRLEALRLSGGHSVGAAGSFYDGGFAAPFDTAAIAMQVNNERQMSTLINAIRQTSQRVLVIEDVEALIDQRLSIQEAAQFNGGR